MTSNLIRTAAVVLAATILSTSPAPGTWADQPKGYMVGLVTVTSTDWVKDYRAENSKLLEKHGGRILVRGKPAEVLEGSAPDGKAILVVEFPSPDHARAWYNDPDYQPLIALRQSGSQADFILMEQLAP